MSLKVKGRSMISWRRCPERVCRIKIPRPMRGMIAPVFSFAILWIDISFHVWGCKGDGTNKIRVRSGQFIYILDI
jgi:hypothetical protein